MWVWRRSSRGGGGGYGCAALREAPSFATAVSRVRAIANASAELLGTADTLVPHVYAQIMQVG